MFGVELFNRLLEGLGDLGPGWVHLVVAALAFAETALFLDLVVPGEVGLVLAGAAAERAGIGLPGLVAAGVAGATVGDSCSYALGRWAGHHRLRRWPRLAARIDAQIDRANAFVSRHGGRAVFLGRWVGALRAIVPFVAGAGGMAYPRFLLWNVAASLGWVTTVVVLGWSVGAPVADAVDRVSGWLSIAVLLGLAVWFVLRRRRARLPADGP